jgi:hypothetical protein
MSMRARIVCGLVCFLAAGAVLSVRGVPPAAQDQPKAAEKPGAFPPFVRMFGCAVLKTDKEIMLKSNGGISQIVTAKEYTPPFALHLKAKTDSKNLRLWYNVGIVIFNWEKDEDELRIHDPITNEGEGFANQGKIEPNKVQYFVWEVYPDGMRVLVDGKERARKRGDYSKIEAPLGVGPAFGSTVTLEMFRVESLKGKLPE